MICGCEADAGAVTDDIELKVDGPTMVRLKPRKAGSFSKKGSRWQGIKAHIERKGAFEMAGLDIHGQPLNPDLDATYDLYKTFEIDFENSPSESLCDGHYRFGANSAST